MNDEVASCHTRRLAAGTRSGDRRLCRHGSGRSFLGRVESARQKDGRFRQIDRPAVRGANRFPSFGLRSDRKPQTLEVIRCSERTGACLLRPEQVQRNANRPEDGRSTGGASGRMGTTIQCVADVNTLLLFCHLGAIGENAQRPCLSILLRCRLTLQSNIARSGSSALCVPAVAGNRSVATIPRRDCSRFVSRSRMMEEATSCSSP